MVKLTLTYVVVDCQWPVNFNVTLSSLEPSIAGVQNLAIMAANSVLNAFALFVSSVASVGGWKGSEEIPEIPIHDLTVATHMGYSQSKLIAEVLLDKASEISGVHSAICRVAIVAGPIEQKLGMWNISEYIPSVIRCLVFFIYNVAIPSKVLADYRFIRLASRFYRKRSLRRAHRLAASRQAFQDPC